MATPLRIIPSKTRQPLLFANPTRASFRHVETETDADANTAVESAETASNIKFRWTSRNNRKGRHALVVRPEDAAKAEYDVPPYSDALSEVCKGVWLMVVYYPVWDISWLVAYFFSWGSLLWLLNAFFIFLPDLLPQKQLDKLVLYGGGITAFLGATVFELGSILLLVEAFNANQSGCFGWAVEQILEIDDKGGSLIRFQPDKHSCHHHHLNKRSLVGIPATLPTQEWTWWPTSDQFRKHYVHDIGFIGSVMELLASTIFWISGITALPGIYDHLSPEAMAWAYWAPQVVGGVLYIIAGILFMVETQKSWWLPELRVLGWHVGLWNVIGGLGFTLCAAFGVASHDQWAQYQAACSTFWGSWAFMFASMLQ